VGDPGKDYKKTGVRMRKAEGKIPVRKSTAAARVPGHVLKRLMLML